MGLSRVTTLEGLHITDLCEDKIAVSPDVQKEMNRLRMEGKLDLCISPVYSADQKAIKMFLKWTILHKHINDVCADSNYLSTDISIFCETRFRHADCDTMYGIIWSLYFISK